MGRYRTTILALKNFKISPGIALRISGYKKRKEKQDYIKEDGQGRYHAVILGKSDSVIEIHYDVYIGGKHVTFEMPLFLRDEKLRILKMLRSKRLQVRELKEGEFIKNLKKYLV